MVHVQNDTQVMIFLMEHVHNVMYVLIFLMVHVQPKKTEETCLLGLSDYIPNYLSLYDFTWMHSMLYVLPLYSIITSQTIRGMLCILFTRHLILGLKMFISNYIFVHKKVDLKKRGGKVIKNSQIYR